MTGRSGRQLEWTSRRPHIAEMSSSVQAPSRSMVRSVSFGSWPCLERRAPRARDARVLAHADDAAAVAQGERRIPRSAGDTENDRHPDPYGIARTIIGPTPVGHASGSFFHSAIANWNFGLRRARVRQLAAGEQLVFPVQRHRLRAPLRLELEGALVRRRAAEVETSQPRADAPSSMLQYSRCSGRAC